MINQSDSASKSNSSAAASVSAKAITPLQRKVLTKDGAPYQRITQADWYDDLSDEEQEVILELHANPYQDFTIQEARDIAESSADLHPGEDGNLYEEKSYYTRLKEMGVLIPESIARRHPDKQLIRNAVTIALAHADGWDFDQEIMDTKIDDLDPGDQQTLLKTARADLRSIHAQIAVGMRTLASKVVKEAVKYDKLALSKKRSFKTAIETDVQTITSNSLEYNSAFKKAFGNNQQRVGLPASQEVDLDGAEDGNAALTYYHKGTSGDPIPIVWYKPPGDYKAVSAFAAQDDDAKTTTNFPGPATVHNSGPKKHNKGKTVKIGQANHGTKLGDEVKKVRHESKREKQRELNTILTKSGHTMGKASSLDGDHIQDLGFSGKDQASNFWPLDATVNRRGFNSYPRYQVHVKNDAEDGVFLRPIGSLIGYHFTIKAFQNKANDIGDAGGGLPNESGKLWAGVSVGDKNSVETAWNGDDE